MRDARPDDAANVVPLLVEAIDHLALQLSGSPDRLGAVPMFTRFFVEPGNRYSHRLVRVALFGNEPSGIALAYPGRREVELIEPIRLAMAQRQPPFDYVAERESNDDEFYLDAIAVSIAHRGKHVADALIEDVCSSARGGSFERVGLLVDADKPGVKRLYERHGFRVDGERLLARHRYEHMQRRI